MLRDLIVGPHQISFDITNKCKEKCERHSGMGYRRQVIRNPG